MSYAQHSQDREQRIRDRSRKPGESQTSADTRAAASRTTPSHFVPLSVRQATWEQKDYRGKAAKRMAQFQSSTAGQAMGGTLENPYGGYDTQNQSTSKPELTPDPIGGGQAQAQAQPGGFLNRLTGAVSSGALGLVSKLTGVEDGSPQANFMRAKADGTLNEAKVAEAQKLASSMGTTFDPKTGYSRTPFLESTRGKSYDPTAETIEGKKSQSETTLPPPSGDSEQGTATFMMPDGAVRKIGANESPSRVIDLAKKEYTEGRNRRGISLPSPEATSPKSAPSVYDSLDEYMRQNPGASKPGYVNKPLGQSAPSANKTGGMRNIAAFSPESAAQENPMLREQAIRGKVSPVEPKAQKPDAGGKVSIAQDNPKSDSVKADKNESTYKKRSPKEWENEFDSVTKEISDFAKENAQGRDRVSLLLKDLTEDKYARKLRSKDDKEAINHIRRITERMSERAKKSDEMLKKEQDKLKSMRVDLNSGRWGYRMKQINQQLERNKAMRGKVAEIRTRYKKEKYPEFNPNS